MDSGLWLRVVDKWRGGADEAPTISMVKAAIFAWTWREHASPRGATLKSATLSSVHSAAAFILRSFLCSVLRATSSHHIRHRPPDMRRDVQEIFRATPHHKQVMMFSATLAKEIRITCKKFMANVSTLFLGLLPASDRGLRVSASGDLR